MIIQQKGYPTFLKLAKQPPSILCQSSSLRRLGAELLNLRGGSQEVGRARGRPAAAADLRPALIVDKVRCVRLQFFSPLLSTFHIPTLQQNVLLIVARLLQSFCMPAWKTPRLGCH